MEKEIDELMWDIMREVQGGESPWRRVNKMRGIDCYKISVKDLGDAIERVIRREGSYRYAFNGLRRMFYAWMRERSDISYVRGSRSVIICMGGSKPPILALS